MKLFLKISAAIAAVALLFFALLAGQIYFYDESDEARTADAAVVLGAAVWGTRLSPVYEERVNHAIELYRRGKVRKIIFTGGRGNADELTEADAGRRYAIEQGVAPAAILTEGESRSTYENLLFAKPLAARHELKTVLLVSDPLHLKRAMAIARALDYDAAPSPTPTTRYRSFSSRMKLLAHETYYYAGFLVRRLLVGT